MALKPCRECKKEVSTEAKTCPHCGVANPVAGASLGGCSNTIVSIVIVIAVVSAINLCSDSKPADPATERAQAKEKASYETKSYALTACQQFVRARLVAPSTANIHPAGSIAESVSDLGNNKWRVQGYYDSQNAFGAMLRGNFVCDVLNVGGHNFNLISVAMK
jgi:hypothetical protein